MDWQRSVVFLCEDCCEKMMIFWDCHEVIERGSYDEGNRMGSSSSSWDYRQDSLVHRPSLSHYHPVMLEVVVLF